MSFFRFGARKSSGLSGSWRTPLLFRNSLSFLATEGVLFSLSGLPDFRLRADDPIRSELLIEDQKSIRFRPGETLALVAACWGSGAFGGRDAIEESVADLGELVGGAALGEAGLPIRAEG